MDAERLVKSMRVINTWATMAVEHREMFGGKPYAVFDMIARETAAAIKAETEDRNV